MRGVAPDQPPDKFICSIFIEGGSPIPSQDTAGVVDPDLQVSGAHTNAVWFNLAVQGTADLTREVRGDVAGVDKFHAPVVKDKRDDRIERLDRVFLELFEGLEALEAGFVRR